MHLKIVNPIKAVIKDYTEEELSTLKDLLTYTNLSEQYLLKRHYNNRTWRSRNSDSWEVRLEELKKNVRKTLIFEENGELFIRPGSIPYIKDKIKKLTIINEIVYPELKKIAWDKPLPFELHVDQQFSVENLIKEKHGNIILTTGSGKSAVMLKLFREMGLQTIIVTPSSSIFNEILEKAEYHFGKAKVGAIGDGKRKLGKKLTIAISKSLVNLKKGTEEYEFVSKAQIFMGDENHLLPADTLESVCHGVLSEIPYRFFFTGTHTRGDGAQTLLESITGKTVHTLTTKEAVEKGYISPHEFRIVQMESSNPNLSSNDPLQMKRIHFLNNKNIANFAAKLANSDAIANGRQTLILVEELNQIAMLIPLLKVPYAVAHSESKVDRLSSLGFSKVDPAESVEKFNKNEVKVLIGTSCISTGTNIFPIHNCINWVGGSSEIKTKQGAVGRSVRLHSHNPWKDRCVQKNKAIIWDFDIQDIYVMEQHLEKRMEFYKESGTDIKYIRLK